MALIPCYECEREISDKAPACPHCGAPKEEQPPQIEEAEILESVAVVDEPEPITQEIVSAPSTEPESVATKDEGFNNSGAQTVAWTEAEAQTEVEEAAASESAWECPSCGSGQLKKFSLVYEEQRSTSHSRTSATGVGLSGTGLGVGVGLANSQGTSLTDLALRVAPPDRQPGDFPVSHLFVSLLGAPAAGYFAYQAAGLLWALGVWLTFWIGGSVIVNLVGLGGGASREIEARYRSESRRWKRSYLCLRCGETAIEGDGGELLAGERKEEKVDALLRQGEKIQAVMVMKERTGLSLAEATQQVEDRAREVNPRRRASSRDSGAPILLVLLVVTVGVFFGGRWALNKVRNDSTSAEEPNAWVTIDGLNRRTCPDVSCGIVGVQFFREGVTVREQSDGWSRVSRSYDASCFNGIVEYVDSGNDACTEANGVVGGQFAEWVSSQYLSSERPPDPAAGATGTEALIGGSDDFRLYRDEFVQATSELIRNGSCSRADFEELGGWLKSSFHAGEPVYFTYCGGMTLANRLYINTATGEVFR